MDWRENQTWLGRHRIVTTLERDYGENSAVTWQLL